MKTIALIVTLVVIMSTPAYALLERPEPSYDDNSVAAATFAANAMQENLYYDIANEFTLGTGRQWTANQMAQAFPGKWYARRYGNEYVAWCEVKKCDDGTYLGRGYYVVTVRALSAYELRTQYGVQPESAIDLEKLKTAVDGGM